MTRGHAMRREPVRIWLHQAQTTPQVEVGVEVSGLNRRFPRCERRLVRTVATVTSRVPPGSTVRMTSVSRERNGSTSASESLLGVLLRTSAVSYAAQPVIHSRANEDARPMDARWRDDPAPRRAPIEFLTRAERAAYLVLYELERRPSACAHGDPFRTSR